MKAASREYENSIQHLRNKEAQYTAKRTSFAEAAMHMAAHTVLSVLSHLINTSLGSFLLMRASSSWKLRAGCE